MSKKVVFILVIIIGFIFVSCAELPNGIINMPFQFKDSFTLRIPTENLINKGASYITVLLTNNDVDQTYNKQVILSGESAIVSFNDILVGNYTILIKVFDSADQLLGSGSGTTDITSSSPANVTINITIPAEPEEPEVGDITITIGVSTSTNTDPSSKNGLFVGITSYTHNSDLNYADNDADDLEYVINLVHESNSYNKVKGEVYKTDVMNKLDQFNMNADFSIFSFSGHGFYSDYLSKICMSDMYTGRDNECISSLELKDKFININGGMVLIIIDACMSGDFIRGNTAELFTKNFVDEFGILTARAPNPYLVIAGCNTTSYSYESSGLQNGMLSFMINDALGGPDMYHPHDPFDGSYNADVNNDRQVTFGELVTYVKPKVMELSSDQQEIQWTAGYDDVVIAVY